MGVTNSRLFHLLTLVGVSLIIAAVCYFLGGLIAEAKSISAPMGIGFKTGGSLAGFLISFLILFVAYQKLGGTALTLQVAVIAQSNPFVRSNNRFTAKTTVLKSASGAKKERTSETIWQAGNLTVLLRDIEQDDLVMIAITDGNGTCWESDFFSPLCPKITLS